MARGFLSEGSHERGGDEEDAVVRLELGWSTDKAWGFRNPFAERKGDMVGGSREKLIWVPRAIKGEPLEWDGPPRQGSGKLTAPRWLLEQKGLI